MPLLSATSMCRTNCESEIVLALGVRVIFPVLSMAKRPATLPEVMEYARTSAGTGELKSGPSFPR
jgi:hypothetical protein